MRQVVVIARPCPASPACATSNARAEREERPPITNAPSTNEPRINDRIRARDVRLVDAEGRQLGIKALPEALSIAQAQDLDLVEVAPLASPPVCRIMDYGKFKFDAAQKAKESRRKANNVGIKEMKYRPKIGQGDFETKTRQVLRFLQDGHKVKVTVMFRGREVYHSDLGKRILDRIAEQLDGIGRVESEARLDGRNMVMVISPDRRARQSAADRAGQESDSSDQSSNGPAPQTDHRPGADLPSEQGTDVNDIAVSATAEPPTSQTGD
ncbi:MAG: translation initiation factor IF-3 [Acidimicrobiales bacterium]